MFLLVPDSLSVVMVKAHEANCFLIHNDWCDQYGTDSLGNEYFPLAKCAAGHF